MRYFLIIIYFSVSACAQDVAESPYSWRVDETTPAGIDIQWDTDKRLDYLDYASYLDNAYAYVKSCMGVDYPPPPLVIFTKLEPGKGGYYFSDSQVIEIRDDFISEYRITEIFKHELVHYFLDLKTGNPDSDHESQFFHCSDFWN